MKYLITEQDLKQSVLNANIDTEYVIPAIKEAQDVYLRLILGDTLLNKVVEDETNKYEELIDLYIKPYLTYKVQSILCLPLNYKLRNMGIVNQYGMDAQTATVQEMKYIQSQYDEKAAFYENRLVDYCKKNKLIKRNCDDITKPHTNNTVSSIYLGRRK